MAEEITEEKLKAEELELQRFKKRLEWEQSIQNLIQEMNRAYQHLIQNSVQDPSITKDNKYTQIPSNIALNTQIYTKDIALHAEILLQKIHELKVQALLQCAGSETKPSIKNEVEHIRMDEC
jgi:hypothetical protein